MFRAFEFIQSYINDLLIITKGDWSDHLEKLGKILQKLKDNGLKFNIENHPLDNRYGISWVLGDSDRDPTNK